jgi:hypothetical protein
MSKIEDELNHMDLMTEKLNTFINMKVMRLNKKNEVISDITYHKDDKAINIQSTSKWLGILLDNPIEATAKLSIYVYLGSTTRRLTIKVANKYAGDEG